MKWMLLCVVVFLNQDNFVISTGERQEIIFTEILHISIHLLNSKIEKES